MERVEIYIGLGHNLNRGYVVLKVLFLCFIDGDFL